MKKIFFLLLLFKGLIFASQSQYPLGYSFEEDSLFLHGISLKEDERNNTVLSIIFYNNNDNIYVLSDGVVEVPGCNIETLSQMKNILKSNLPISCKRAFALHGKEYSEMAFNEFIFLLYKKKESDFRTVFIFKNKRFVSSVVSNMNNKKLLKLLLSVKAEDRSSKNINDYISSYKKYFDKGFFNRSFKELIGALILDPKNENLHNLYHELLKKRSEKANLADKFYYKLKH